VHVGDDPELRAVATRPDAPPPASVLLCPWCLLSGWADPRPAAAARGSGLAREHERPVPVEIDPRTASSVPWSVPLRRSARAVQPTTSHANLE